MLIMYINANILNIYECSTIVTKDQLDDCIPIGIVRFDLV